MVTLPGFTSELDALPSYELILSASQLRRLRAHLSESLAELEYQRKTMSRAHVGYHAMLDAIQSDLADIYEQTITARAGVLAGV